MSAIPFWSVSTKDLVQKLQSSSDGLTTEEANQRILHYGSNTLKPKKRTSVIGLFLSQFKSPIIIILLFAASLSLFLADTTDSIIIFVIIIASGLLTFWQERGATNAISKLLALVRITATVIRNGSQEKISAEQVVPGDITILSAGSSVPADCIILESKDLFVNESTFTGETYPAEKIAGTVPLETPLAKRSNSLFMGTSIVSGHTKALVVTTGKDTEFGRISEHLRLRVPETEFERGIRQFGYLLMQITLVLVVAIFAINVYLARPVLEAFLFALALAVGLTPQLLPAIISVNLSHGAKLMAEQKVIVKRLSSIENFGSMNIFCVDKTGTLTEGVVRIKSCLDAEGNENDKVLLYSYIDAFFETGFTNPIDEAIRSHTKIDLTKYKKLDEIPYDFIRKRLTILVTEGGENLMVTKGALQSILSICSTVETKTGISPMSDMENDIFDTFTDLSKKGYRVLGVSYKKIAESNITKEKENEMIFLGFLVFFDPPKPGIENTIKQLKNLGIELKIVTGDNKVVAESLSKQVGILQPRILTGKEIYQMSDEALYGTVNKIDVFADVEPNQKERIVTAFKKCGNVVGCMGDGINDASALHAADVGISVDSAADVAKEASDIVLLEKNLSVLVQGVKEGRKTFANTLKYVFMATSANFGNMFSMAGASIFLSFLPLLPKQILLTNLLTDIPEMSIANDSVDEELVYKPRRWNIKFIRRFMLSFGLLSSIFDFLTFGLLLVIGSSIEQFRTGWFTESVISASLIVLVIRSRRPFFKSKPGKLLFISTIVIVATVILVPLTPIGNAFGFAPLSPSTLAMIGLVVVSYMVTAELIKRMFYRRVKM